MINNLNFTIRYVWVVQSRNSIIPSITCFLFGITQKDSSCSWIGGGGGQHGHLGINSKSGGHFKYIKKLNLSAPRNRKDKSYKWQARRAKTLIKLCYLLFSYYSYFWSAWFGMIASALNFKLKSEWFILPKIKVCMKNVSVIRKLN